MQTMREKEDRFHQQVQAVIGVIGEGWHYGDTKTDCYRDAVREPDGMKIGFWFSHDGRVEVTPRAPDHNGKYQSLRDWGVIPYGQAAPSMTYAIDRDSLRVAKEIHRKIIEPYNPLYAEILEKLAGWKQRAQDTATLIGKVAAKLPGSKSHEYNETGREFSLFGRHETYGQLRVQPYGRIDVEIRSLSEEDGLKLCDWINANLPKTKD